MPLRPPLPATAVASPRGEVPSAPGSPQSDDGALDLETPEHLQHALGELGIHGPLASSQLFDLVALAVQRPDLENHIQQMAAALSTRQGVRAEIKTGLEALWQQHRHSHPAAARVIELVMNPVGTFVTTAPSLEEGDDASDLEVDLDAYLETQRDEELDEGDVEGDLERLKAPLGHQIRTWMGSGMAQAATADPHAFDDEPQAPAFARVLERLHDEAYPGFSPAAQQQLASQVRTTILAIARDPDLRSEVYLISQTALGDCRDNLLDGFSKVMLAVRNRQMVLAVRAGKINEAQLNGLMGQQFRLSLLETATNRLIHQMKQRTDLPPWKAKWLQADPLETLAHAKAALKRPLQLPQDTAQDLTNLDFSALDPKDIAALHSEVLAQAADPQAYPAFLMHHETWRVGIQELHQATFQPLEDARDNHPFLQLPWPDDHESPAAFEYSRQAREIYSEWEASVNTHLQALAAQAGGAMPPNHPRPPEAGPSRRTGPG
ncbi:NEL-type E3 ubiquitin ligase domain-containing protein [Acidovorax sp. SUPP2825]|uniref:NEL-type E3 ubiquitin ligase domain-containing protein n=1 Tax=Acidovorax sp. SUPP2825 TaxID=2920879 RepID=UPI0023DE2CB8|nr:NEL-type E3 ubiquitin ligase domain-containing protein [Acidovorax sp. SUPP2825]GKS93553.1 hypothetical protein AVAK2825_03480 [Acidovorax sp. SUPP2825]